MSKRILSATVTGVLLLVFTTSVFAAEPSGQGAPASDTITVVGNGTAYASPDVAYISLGVEIINPDVTAAVNSATETINAVNAALSGFGISEADVRTENFYIYREPIYGPEGPTGEGNFRVSHTLRVTVRDTEQVPDILSAALGAGANSVGGVMYDVEDKSALESEARRMAIDNARAKAEELAQLLNVSIGDVVMVVEQPNYSPVFAGYGGGGGGFEAAVAAPPIAPGSLAVSVSVQISYAIVR